LEAVQYIDVQYDMPEIQAPFDLYLMKLFLSEWATLSSATSINFKLSTIFSYL